MHKCQWLVIWQSWSNSVKKWHICSMLRNARTSLSIYSPDGVFVKGDWKICAKFTFFFIRFVHDCSSVVKPTLSFPTSSNKNVCFVAVKAVQGNYTEWSEWSDCSTSCGTGEKFRTRNCTNPRPAFGGMDCSFIGMDRDVQKCELRPCAGEYYGLLSMQHFGCENRFKVFSNIRTNREKYLKVLIDIC